MKVNPAKESIHVQNAREKIKKRLEETEKRTNPEALHQMVTVIQHQLSRHERITLKKITATFDKNQHPATESKVVKRLLEQLKQKINEPTVKQLEGRIKPMAPS